MGVNQTPQPGLSVRPVALLDQPPAQHQWLVQDLWSHLAVGVIGGPPKSCKTWLGLDLAVSVASATPCLGTFEVDHSGPVLVYLAEDSLPMVRLRIEAICRHRGLSLDALNLYVVDAPSLRLDLAEDRRRLQTTLESFRPALLLLDPLVRLHQLDENNSGDISRLLGYLRNLQRRFHLAIALTHHMGKRNHGRLGQALRGSSDIHAWSDSSAYLQRKSDHLVLTVEHRSASPREPVPLKLVTNDDQLGAHLEVFDEPQPDENDPHALAFDVQRLLTNSPYPLTRTELRRRLHVNNKRLGDTLLALEQQNLVVRTTAGWTAGSPAAVSTPDNDPRQLNFA